MTNPDTLRPIPQDLDALELVAEDRALVLDVCAELYEEIAAFMDGVTGRTFEAYDAARDKPEINALMRKHRQALNIRDDYRGLARENRQDAEIYRALLARSTTQSGCAEELQPDLNGKG